MADHNQIVYGVVYVVSLEAVKGLVDASGHLKAAFVQWNTGPESPPKGFLLGVASVFVGIVLSAIVVRNTGQRGRIVVRREEYAPACR